MLAVGVCYSAGVLRRVLRAPRSRGASTGEAVPRAELRVRGAGPRVRE